VSALAAGAPKHRAPPPPFPAGRDCAIQDLDTNGVPRHPGSDGAPSVLLRIAHKDPSKPAVKKHHSIILKAETVAEKMSWLARLKAASEGPGALQAPQRGAPPPLQSLQGQAGSQARRSPGQPQARTLVLPAWLALFSRRRAWPLTRTRLLCCAVLGGHGP
jgi:hypothetical protein